MNKYGVFISYSHEDENLVAPVVQLMRTMRQDKIFKDKEDIKPGKPWEIQLTTALEEAELVAVFWCEHAGKSDYVCKEYTSAIEAKKDVLPILLDNYRMNEALSAYQWIDLRDVVVHDLDRAEIKAFMDWKQSRTQSGKEVRSNPIEYGSASKGPQSYPHSRKVKKRDGSLSKIWFYLAGIITVIVVTVFFSKIMTFIYEYISQIALIIGAIITITATLFLYRKSYYRKSYKKDRRDDRSKYEMQTQIVLPKILNPKLEIIGKSEIAAEVILNRIKEKVEAKFMNSQD